MRVEANEVPFDRLKDVQVGDIIWLYFASNLNAAVVGRVLAVREDRVRLQVHSVEGSLMVDAEGCLAWDVVVPWTSVGFMRQCTTRPVGCKCSGDRQ